MFDSMFQFSYHDQMQMVLWLLWWFVIVCQFAGQFRTKPVPKPVGAMPIDYLSEDEENELDEVTSVPDDCLLNTDSSNCVSAGSAFKPAPESVVESSIELDFISCDCWLANQIAPIDYSKLTIRELKAICKERTGTSNAIKNYSRMSKAQLIERLSAQQ